MTEAEKLTEAYHLLFDVKDSMWPESTVETGVVADGNWDSGQDRYAVYSAINALETAMRRLNVPVPLRFDWEGRQVALRRKNAR